MSSDVRELKDLTMTNSCPIKKNVKKMNWLGSELILFLLVVKDRLSQLKMQPASKKCTSL